VSKILIDRRVVFAQGPWRLVRATGLACDWFPGAERGTTRTVWVFEHEDGRRRGFRTQREARRWFLELSLASQGVRA
jgi:hypothetical protein